MPPPAIAMAIAVLRGDGRLTAQVVDAPLGPEVRRKTRSTAKQHWPVTITQAAEDNDTCVSQNRQTIDKIFSPAQKNYAKAVVDWADSKAVSDGPVNRARVINDLPTTLPDVVRDNILNVLSLLNLAKI
jgi:hypothetical protein